MGIYAPQIWEFADLNNQIQLWIPCLNNPASMGKYSVNSWSYQTQSLGIKGFC